MCYTSVGALRYSIVIANKRFVPVGGGRCTMCARLRRRDIDSGRNATAPLQVQQPAGGRFQKFDLAHALVYTRVDIVLNAYVLCAFVVTLMRQRSARVDAMCATK